MALSSAFHTGNRRTLQSTLKAGELIMVTAYARLQKSADLTFFHQDRDFLYLTGINEPDWLIVITPDEEFLIAPKLHRIERLFDGGADHEQASKMSGVNQVYEDAAGWKRLDSLLKKAKEVQIVQHDEKLWFRTVPNPAQRRLTRRIKARTKAEVVSIHPQVHAMRAVKQPEEIKALKQAIAITGDTLAEVKSQLSSYVSENEIAADIGAGFIKRGSPGHAFEPIVASGINTCTVHYIENNQPLNKETFVLLDVGADIEGYAADIARTYALSEPTPRQVALHKAVEHVRKETIKLIRPGLAFKEYFVSVDELMGEQLVELGLIKKPTRDSVRQYFPYGVSHLLGLDVHDVGAGSEGFLEGMVLTVEPGIHIPEEALGIRIEDNILVTKTGAQNLSDKISREL